MKRRLYFILITVTAILVSISSCTKDTLSSAGSANTGNNTRSSVNATSLQANNWVKDANGFYVHTFNGIISPGRPVKVYLLTEGREEQINHYMFFMGGQLWASIQGSDLKIYFRYSGQLPFTSLNIKVIIE